MRKGFYSSIVLVLFSVILLTFPYKIFAISVIPDHPRLLLTNHDINGTGSGSNRNLREETSPGGAYEIEFGLIEEKADQILDTIPDSEYNARVWQKILCFTHLMKKDTGGYDGSYGDAAIRNAITGGFDSSLEYVYDWVYDILTDGSHDDDKAEIETRLYNIGVTEYKPFDPTIGIFHGSTRYINRIFYIAVALADEGIETETVDGWLVLCQDGLNEQILAAHDEVAYQGYWFVMDASYDVGQYINTAQISHIWKVATGEDYWDQINGINPYFVTPIAGVTDTPGSQFLRNLPLAYLYRTTPGYNTFQQGDQRFGEAGLQLSERVRRYTLSKVFWLAANYYDDSAYQWFGDETYELRDSESMGNGEYEASLAFMIIYRKPSIAAQKPLSSNMPLVKFFEDQGEIIMKQGWNVGLNDTGNNELNASFRCQVGRNGHSHNDQNSFQIYRGVDKLATDSGVHEASDPVTYKQRYYRQSIAHNTILVNNRGQKTVPQTNSIGTYRPPIKGFIDIFKDHGSYTYSRGDAEDAYHKEPPDPNYGGPYLDEFFRECVYLKFPTVGKGYYLIFDTLTPLDLGVDTFQWLLHSVNRPESIDGVFTEARNAYNGTIGETSTDTNIIKVSNGNSAMFVNRVFPTEVVITRRGGPDVNGNYRSSGAYDHLGVGEGAIANNIQYPYGDVTAAPHPLGSWKFETEVTSSAEGMTHILHVLQVDDAQAGRVQVSGIDTGEFYGAMIEDVQYRYCFFNKSPIKEETISYSIASSGIGNNIYLVCGLQSGEYWIYKDSETVFIDTRSVGDDGTLYFECSGEGEFEVTRASQKSSFSSFRGTIQ